MNIARYQQFDESELLARLQCTRLRGFDNAEVYRKAQLKLLTAVDSDALTPAQHYVLRAGVATIIALYHSFCTLGIDIFGLRGGVLFWPESAAKDAPPIPLIPPVVEESDEPDGRRVHLINDGIHRLYAARKLNIRPNIVLVRQIPTQYPYYAYALNGWHEVAELDQLQPGHQKKTYRMPHNYKALFRDFNGIFSGVQQQRPRTNPDHLKA